MTTTLFTLISAILLLTFSTGCTSNKTSAPLACFKGSPSCYSQGESSHETCVTCQATII